MTARASMEGGGRGLGLGPAALYPLKALVTRARSLAWRLRPRRSDSQKGIRILFYHRVSDDRDELAVTPARFEQQLGWLAAAGYRVVDVLEAVRLLRDGVAPPRTIALSFDDAYLDVADHAVPVLARHGFRASVFVATGVTDGRAHFSWYLEQPPLIGWERMGELDREETLRFEAHTVTHPNLLDLDDGDARREIVASKRELEEKLGRPVEVFCYPAGLFTARERGFVEEAGFVAAVSCEPGVNGPDADLLALRRTQIDARDGLIDFRAKVGGGHDAPLPLRAAWRKLRYGSSRS